MARYVQRSEARLDKQSHEKKLNLENVLAKFIWNIEASIQASKVSPRNREDSIHDLENQTKQLAEAVLEEKSSYEEQVVEITFKSDGMC